jgi:hypothetical protein
MYRWVAALGLVAAAEDQRAADIPETNAMGVLAAHAACEAMLGQSSVPFHIRRASREKYSPDVMGIAAPVAKPLLPCPFAAN